MRRRRRRGRRREEGGGEGKEEEGRLSTNQAQTKHKQSTNRHYPQIISIVSRESSFHSPCNFS